MKKWHILVIVLVIIFISPFLLSIWISFPSELLTSTSAQDICARFGIEFNSSSVTKIYQSPDAILDDPVAFWIKDPAYKLVAMAPMYRDETLPPGGWTRNIE